MPQTTPAIYQRRQAVSEHWLPARVARRMVAKYGWLEATKRLFKKWEHYVQTNDGVRYVAQPERWIYWERTTKLVGQVPVSPFADVRAVA